MVISILEPPHNSGRFITARNISVMVIQTNITLLLRLIGQSYG